MPPFPRYESDLEDVAGESVEVRFFEDGSAFAVSMTDDEIISDLEKAKERFALLTNSGLIAAARSAGADVAYYERCLLKDPESKKGLGVRLSGRQERALVKACDCAYQWGTHDRYGDLVNYHITKFGKTNSAKWTWNCGDGAGDANFLAWSWGIFSFSITPLSVVKKINELQKSPFVQILSVFAFRDCRKNVNAAALVANCYRIGIRLIARWGKDLVAIKEIDK